MNREFLKLGLYSFLLAVVIFTIGLIASNNLEYGSQQVVGFIVIVTTLVITVYSSLKHIRDNMLEGKLKFGRAFMYGLLITFFTGLGIALADFIYIKIINTDYFPTLIEAYENGLKETLSPEEFAKQKEQLDGISLNEKLSSYVFMMYFMTVFWGFFVSLTMAMILKRKK